MDQEKQSTASPDSQSSSPTEVLRPELQPIAARWGRPMLDFAVQMAAANTALDQLLLYSQTHSKIQGHVGLLLSALGDIAQGRAAASGWNWDQIIECLLDVSRASKLAQPAANSHGKPS